MSSNPLQEPETRAVEWRWAQRSEQVTLPRSHWLLFDRLCERRGCSPDDLHLEISLQQPTGDTAPIASAIARYLDEKLGRGLGEAPTNEGDDPTPRRGRGLGW